MLLKGSWNWIIISWSRILSSWQLLHLAALTVHIVMRKEVKGSDEQGRGVSQRRGVGSASPVLFALKGG